MERITSFCVDHTKLEVGIYVSRVDEDITTFDIRMKKPNVDEALDPKSAHTIEHIAATLLRNGEHKENIIYFGPMGCMTGFYLITKHLSLEDIKGIVKNIFVKIASWEEEIPGAKIEECGNYTYMDLSKAKEDAKQFVNSSWHHSYHFL